MEEGLGQAGPEERQTTNLHEEIQKNVIRGGAGRYFFDMAGLERFDIGPHYSSAHGSAVRGERLQVVLVNKRRGTGSRLHTHANEQFNYVLTGSFKFRVENVEGVAGPGQLVYIPANVEHYFVATGEGDGSYLALKDASYYVAGEAVDGRRTGAHYEPGFEPDVRARA